MARFRLEACSLTQSLGHLAPAQIQFSNLGEISASHGERAWKIFRAWGCVPEWGTAAKGGAVAARQAHEASQIRLR